MTNRIKAQLFALFVLAFAYFNPAPEVTAQEMTGERLIEQHLDAIGTKQVRDTIKNRMAVGTSHFQSKLPSKEAGGKALVASDNSNLMFITSFNSQEYPFEKIGYFNKNISLPWVTSGTRSPLGAFLADHASVLSEGLFMGSVSNSWAFLVSDKAENRVKYAGTKKVADRKVYLLEYYPKSAGTQFSARLFFDTETFRHVRSEYRDQINPRQDTFGTLGRQGGVTIRLVETFDDFRTVNGLTLPYLYTAEYLTDSNSGVFEYTWTIKIQQYVLNQNFASDFFTFEKK